jgi:hypothetical protein
MRDRHGYSLEEVKAVVEAFFGGTLPGWAGDDANEVHFPDGIDDILRWN